MARAGVGYSVGREDNGRYGETYNGVQLMDRHQFPDGIDPYVIEGDSSSGLLYGISPEPVEANGTADRKVQAYNYRITLTDRPGNRVEITKPGHYDPQRYELLLRLKQRQPWQSLRDVFIWNEMPNGKTDINNFGGFSTDVIGENWNYPEAGYSERERIRKFHEDYTKGLLYFIGHDPRIPDSVRHEMQRWGYPADEYADNGYWSHQLYVREARRMVGELVMTQHHCEGRQVVPDPVGWAAYGMDSHNCDRHVVGGMVKNEGNVEIALAAPYPISYRAITPKRDEEFVGSRVLVRIPYRVRINPDGTRFHGFVSVRCHCGLPCDRPARWMRSGCRCRDRLGKITPRSSRRRESARYFRR